MAFSLGNSKEKISLNGVFAKKQLFVMLIKQRKMYNYCYFIAKRKNATNI